MTDFLQVVSELWSLDSHHLFEGMDEVAFTLGVRGVGVFDGDHVPAEGVTEKKPYVRYLIAFCLHVIL